MQSCHAVLVAFAALCLLTGRYSVGAEVAKEDKPIVVTLDQLAKDYAENEDKANEKYKGKVVQLTGEVCRFGTTSFEVQPKDGKKSVARCWYDKDQKDTFDKLKKGDSVTVQGICTGFLMGCVEFDKCKPVK